MIEAAPDQAADIFQILGKQGIPHLAVTGEGDIVLGSQNDPNGIVLHDTVDGGAYSLRVSDGQLALRRA
jgi:hypothetical protein